MTNEMIEWHSLNTEDIAVLTEDQVKHYCRVAAMEAGVITTEVEPEFMSEDKPELNYVELWIVDSEYMPKGLAFGSREDAEAFIRLKPIGIDSKYLGSGWVESVNVIRVLSGMEAKRSENVITEGEYERHVATLNQFGDAVKYNKELRNDLENRQREYANATEWLWKEWHEAKAKRLELEEVRTCFEEYKSLAKTEAGAITCLKKAYKDKSVLLHAALGDGWDAAMNVGEQEAN